MKRIKFNILPIAVALSASSLGCFGNSNNSSSDAGPSVDATPSPDVSQPQSDASTPEAGPPKDSGGGVDAVVEASPSGIIPPSVDFNVVGCGAPAASKTFNVVNTGLVAVTYSATLSTGSVFAITGASSGTVAPGMMGALTLTATVPAAATAGVPLTGQLTVTTNVPGFAMVPVPLSVTPGGGAITVLPTTAGFGQAQIGSPAAALALAISNTGNEAVGVSVGAPTDPEFTLSYTGAPAVVTLQPGDSVPLASANFTPTSAGAKTATAPIATTGTLCGTSATTVAMSGTGIAAPVTVGPSPLDYGTFTCGEDNRAQAQAVTIANGYTFPITYTAALTKGTSSPYTMDAPTGTVPAGGKAIINVAPVTVAIPATVAPNGYGDTLTVTTSAPDVPPATVLLKESASGAVLTINMAKTSFASVPINSTATLPFSIVNSGTVDAPVTIATTGTVWSEQAVGSTATANGGAVPGNLSFAPLDTAPQSTTLSVTTTAPLCAVTASLTPSGQGIAPDATFAGGPFTVETTCSGGSAGTQQLVITNSGSTPLQLSSVGSTQGYVQILSAPSTPIAPGANAFIVFQARDAVFGVDAAGQYGDAISITTNEVDNPTHQVPVSVLIHGANLSYSSDNPLVSSSCGLSFQGYSIVNTGDLDVAVSATSGYSTGSDGPITFDGVFGDGAVTIPHQDGVGDIVFFNDYTCAAADVVTFSSPPSPTNPVCIPLAAPDLPEAIPGEPGDFIVEVQIPTLCDSLTPSIELNGHPPEGCECDCVPPPPAPGG